MIQTHEMPTYTWIDASVPTDAEIDSVITDYRLPLKFKDYMTDKHEQPRAKLDITSDFCVLVIRAISHVVATAPIFIGFDDKTLITVFHEKEASPISQLEGPQKQSLFSQVLEILSVIIDPYTDKLVEISKKAERLQQKKTRVNGRMLNQVSAMKRDLVYYQASTAGNLYAVKNLQSELELDGSSFVKLTDNQSQNVADLEIEYNECSAMFSVIGTVVGELETSFGNITNDHLNETMRFLTVWSLILAVPPIVSGFYGMNVKLPLADHSEAWIGTLWITLVLIAGMMFILWRNNHRK